jgi:multisubunit Na+/H+ antiporter MnhB subunit
VLLIQGLLEALFHQSVLVQFAIFLAVGLVVYGLACGFLVLCNRRQARPAEWIPVAPFATSITTVFALFLAFHASSIWANIARAERAHTAAEMAIKRLDEALSPSQLNLPQFRQELHRYVGYVAKDEWRKGRNRTVSPRASAALAELNAMALAAAGQLPSPAAGHLIALLNEIAHSRADKTWLGANHTETSSWLIVFALGVLAHIAVAAVHFDRPKAGFVALAIFASTTVVAYTALGMIDDPYRYLDSLDPSHRVEPD